MIEWNDDPEPMPLWQSLGPQTPPTPEQLRHVELLKPAGRIWKDYDFSWKSLRAECEKIEAEINTRIIVIGDLLLAPDVRSRGDYDRQRELLDSLAALNQEQKGILAEKIAMRNEYLVKANELRALIDMHWWQNQLPSFQFD
jgi:hypothetical protein